MPEGEELNRVFGQLLNELGIPEERQQTMMLLPKEKKWLLITQHKDTRVISHPNYLALLNCCLEARICQARRKRFFYTEVLHYPLGVQSYLPR